MDYVSIYDSFTITVLETLEDLGFCDKGKGGAFVRTKVKNLINGKVLERTFRSGEKVEEPDVQESKLQYLYNDGSDLVFMDTDTYDQIPIAGDVIGDSHSSIFDAGLTQVIQGRMVKVISWYDNEWGYSTRVEELIDRVARMDA